MALLRVPGPIADKAIADAEANVGAAEVPKRSNWGPYVKKYLNSVGINFPAPWCLAFIVYRLKEASRELNLQLPQNFCATGYCPSFGAWAKSNQLVVPVREAQRGDIILLWGDQAQRLHHSVMISSVEDGWFNTVEGNSNTDGSAEGWEVVKHKRYFEDLGSRSLIVRIPW